MKAETLVKEGDLNGALQDLQEHVRNRPDHAPYRLFLFQLLALLGEWERAYNQLQVAAQLDNSMLLVGQAYREVIQCEKLRQEVFAGRREPLLMGEPQQWIVLMIEALRLDERSPSAAAQLRLEALDLAATSSGTLDGHNFEWLADADTRLGPIFEIMLNGNYYWVPVSQVQQIKIDPPSDLRDLVWLPVHCTWKNGGEGHGFIPTRYPGSENSPDSAIQLARKTTWEEPVTNTCRGLGQRLLASDQDDFPLLDVRELTFIPAE